MTREEAIEVYNGLINTKIKEAFEFFAPELAESEDERIRKKCIEIIKRVIPNGDSQSQESKEILDCIAYLEKQKDCIFVRKSHLDPVGELGVDGMKIMEGDNETETQKAYREGKNAGRKEVFDHPEYYGLQLRRMYDYETGKRNPAWSDEEEDMLNSCISSIEEAKENRYAYKETDGDTSYDYEIAWLKSLRPSWKPSKEQLGALDKAIPVCMGVAGREEVAPLESLYEQLKKL